MWSVKKKIMSSFEGEKVEHMPLYFLKVGYSSNF